MSMKIYIAGTHIYSPSFYAELHRCIHRDIRNKEVIALLPDEKSTKRSSSVYKVNIELIKQCDGIIADVNPYRGELEPDSGTVFEIGFAKALNKQIVFILEDLRTVKEKMNDSSFGCYQVGQVWRDNDGDFIENYHLPLNSVLFHAADQIVSTMEEAFGYFQQLGNLSTTAKTSNSE
ncbi:hypothetical protein CUZ56_01363 [Saezia sanguinis]|uniref:Nucleoside 2-deoxyribosyltransferase n=1 Tax=Saezia sanguinis TaxID=1965230 RepID=A0A433SFA6_9BURK|nr:nucleoside 2-deoxyribosyltransferase [Saezia sanguinis]RUS67418.1 hypothetical protein CUZ56_01363 [Saezia sanguinis]